MYASGARGEAESLCRATLERKPEDVAALTLLGIILAQSHRAGEAARLFEQAVARTPDDPAAHINHGTSLRDLGRHVSALRSYERALAIQPEHVEGHYNRGVTLQALRRYGEALECYDRTLALEPRHAAAWNGRGETLRALGRLEEALTSYTRALSSAPDHAEAHNNRGITLQALGRFEEALASFERALALRPDSAESLNNHGAALHELQHFEQALSSYQRALASRPDYVQALSNLGVALHELERYDEALSCHDRAIALLPDLADAHDNRGVTLRALRRLEEAVASHRRALEIEPHHVKAQVNQGAVLWDLRRHSEALACYERALALEPLAKTYRNEAAALEELGELEDAVASYGRALALDPDGSFLLGDYRHARMQICDWAGFEADQARIVSGLEQGRAMVSPFAALSLLDRAESQRQAAEIWARRECTPRRPTQPPGPYPRHEKIRIGYFSADFRTHALTALTAEMLESHDRSGFELTAFSLGPDVRDAARTRLEPVFERFLSLAAASDGEVAALARQLEIDIAVDLGGYTRGARPRIFALRAAPIQVSYLGFLGTTGAGCSDYLIADPVIVPPPSRRYYVEQIAYLPSYQPNDSKRVIAPRIPARAELGLPPSGFVFCCFNAHYKINPETLTSWARILAAVPGSVLFLLGGNAAAERNLRRSAADRGVDSERLVFGRRLPFDEYLARYRAADLFLDTLPYNAGATASDALWAGLPLLSCCGETFASRVAASLLTAAGLPELIAADRRSYEELAIGLAADAPRLTAIRSRLAAARQTAPLFDTAAFTRNLEALYRRMYERSRSGLPPQHLA
jgi:predicted O-linked N-acetylglucosamine transferase (SPINDLY family)